MTSYLWYNGAASSWIGRKVKPEGEAKVKAKVKSLMISKNEKENPNKRPEACRAHHEQGEAVEDEGGPNR